MRPPHPLALRLAERLQTSPAAAILDVGTGSGRNADALRNAGFTVTAVSDADAAALALPAGVFDGAIATHALLHGTPDRIAALLARTAAVLRPGAPLCAVFASVRDARCGEGQRIGPRTFAALTGDEAGVPHTFFSEEELRALLEPPFAIERIAERCADEIAGRWAHPTTPLRGAVHWLVEAIRRDAVQ